MKNIVLALATACVLTSSVALAEQPLLPRPTPAPIAPVPTLRAPVKPVLQRIDPAATAIDFGIVARKSQFGGRVRIVGKVKNVGNAAFVSGPTQQSAQLWEVVPGTRPRLVGQTSFQNLAPGAEVSVAFERGWNASSAAEGEFPPSYRVVLAYDPDIAIDGNPRNDDWQSGNNTLERSGTAINALFH